MLKEASSVRETDILCQNCFNRFKEIATESLEGWSQSDENFIPEQTSVEELNDFVDNRCDIPKNFGESENTLPSMLGQV